MAQLRWAQASLVLLHILVYVVLTLCVGTWGQRQVRKAWEQEAGEVGALGGLGTLQGRVRGGDIFSGRQRPARKGGI